MVYSHCPVLAALFLLDASDEQFVFSLLPAEMRGNMVFMLVGAALEFRFIQFLMAMAHFGAFHCVTFLRVIQTSLVHSTASVK